jgi:peptidoglycan/LPS O-acetylase OafA/YrhL
VSIEEQFYLLWPPIVRELSRDQLVFAAITMLLLSNTMRIVMVAIHAGPHSVWCNTLCRMDPIALGILVAAVLHGRIPNFSITTRLGMLFCGTLPVVLIANYWNITVPESLEWVPTLIGVHVVAISSMLITLAALGISARPHAAFLYLGKISYGLYVYHALGMVLTHKFFPLGTHFRQLVFHEALAFVITLLLASTSYALLEKPFLQLKKRFERIDSRPV